MDTARPPLWVTDDSGAPLLRGVHCEACGADLFPPQEYGCTICGAYGEGLSECRLAARGTVVTFAEVHLHPSHPVPFTLIEVALDAGPVVRALLASDGAPRIGQRAHGVVVAEEPAQLAFALEEQE